MVALLVGTLLTAAVVSTFLVSRAGYSLRAGKDSIQDNGRIATQLLSEDLRMAGWWGVNTQSQYISPGETRTRDYGCGEGWASNTAQTIFVYNQDNYTGRPACIHEDNYLKGTDIVVVRHAGEQLLSEDDIRKGSVYLHTGLSTGLLFEADSDGEIDSSALLTESTPQYIHPLVTHIYYVRPWSQTRGDGIPTLVRAALKGNETENEPLVEFIENLQITLGRDTNGDGSVDIYTNADAAMTQAQWAQVRSILMEALVRAPNIEPGYSEEISYALGDIEVANTSGPYRRGLFSSTVYIRN
jgi:type IV pilus assembly protein PilW